MQYVQVSDSDNKGPFGLPIEEDGSVLMTTLKGLFPNSCGLRIRLNEGDLWRWYVLNQFISFLFNLFFK